MDNVLDKVTILVNGDTDLAKDVLESLEVFLEENPAVTDEQLAIAVASSVKWFADFEANYKF